MRAKIIKVSKETMAGFLKTSRRHTTSNAPDDLRVVSVRETRHPFVFEVVCESQTFPDVRPEEIPGEFVVEFTEDA
jgi:hypothetical protein